MNVSSRTTEKECTSCGVCSSVCNKEAISIALNSEGFYRPVVASDLCNNCGLCTTVCYKFDNNIYLTSEQGLKEKPLFSGWANNDKIVANTTSGGIGDILAQQLLTEGYKVVGVVYNEDEIRAEHRIANVKQELDDFRGSKYIQSYTFDAFKEVVKNCRNTKYAVFGTPCQIYALNKIAHQRKVRDNFFFVDLYCHGCPTLYVWTKFHEELKRKLNIRKFDKVTFRSKLRGWGSFNVLVRANGRNITNSKYNDKFYELFFCDQLLNMACNDCQLRSTLEYTDIRLGDFWGKKYLSNHRGVSAVSVSTSRGKEMFEKIKSKITFFNCDYQEFLPWQSWGKSYSINTKIRKAVLGSLSNPQENVNDAIKTLRKNQSNFRNIVRVVKCVVSVLPPHFINTLKAIKYSLLK